MELMDAATLSMRMHGIHLQHKWPFVAWIELSSNRSSHVSDVPVGNKKFMCYRAQQSPW